MAELSDEEFGIVEELFLTCYVVFSPERGVLPECHVALGQPPRWPDDQPADGERYRPRQTGAAMGC